MRAGAYTAGYLVLVFFLIGIVHLYWAFGGQKGLRAAIPENEKGPLFEAKSFGTFLIAFTFFTGSFAAAMEMFAIYLISWQHYLYHVVGIVFFARAIGEFKYVGFFKKVKGTKFAHYDTFFYSPLCLSVSFCALLSFVFS